MNFVNSIEKEVSYAPSSIFVVKREEYVSG